ncbi:MAG: glycosyltransferase [Anaerolineae bacterium]|nr:glycosyltransferase [Anaerolineae bacterium]
MKGQQMSGIGLDKVSVAVAIPCYNEAITIAKVIADFREALPQAAIHVFDNNSADGSAALAEKAGAVVHVVRKQGKGHVMRAVFDTLAADVIVVVDGDDTYFAEDAIPLIEPLLGGQADMVVGNRLQGATDDSMVRMHQFGNTMIVAVINRMFGTRYKDILSGYRAFNRKFIESVPLLTGGFEIETELTLQALEEGFDVVEIPISYRSRPPGSVSKLRSFHDGYKIMLTAAILLRDHQPLRLFGGIGFLCLLALLAAGGLRLANYLELTDISNTLLVGIMLLFAPVGMISFGIGLLLSAINARFRQLKQYMQRNKNN